jgi:hypothetical protein
LVLSSILEEDRDTASQKREVEGRKEVKENTTESNGSSGLSVFKCYDLERENPFVLGEALKIIRAMQEDDKENLLVTIQ